MRKADPMDLHDFPFLLKDLGTRTLKQKAAVVQFITDNVSRALENCKIDQRSVYSGIIGSYEPHMKDSYFAYIVSLETLAAFEFESKNEANEFIDDLYTSGILPCERVQVGRFKAWENN